MKLSLFAALLAAATVTAPVLAADVGVSVSIGEPGFFGRIDIGDAPQPQLIYRQPRVIEQVPMNRPPVYLHVRPGEEDNWREHCNAYNACGERVYFVADNWYSREYVPHYQKQHGNRGNDRHGNRNDHGNQNDRHGNDRGNGSDR